MNARWSEYKNTDYDEALWKFTPVRHHIQKFFIDIVASIHYSEDINDTKILLGICSCLLKNTIGGQIDKKEIGITLQQYIVSFISFIFCLQNLLSILVLLYAAVCLLT